MSAPHRPAWFVRRDLDGFFGLFVDNLVQLLVIIQLCGVLCGLSIEFIYMRILPGAAISIFCGNMFYWWQARRLAARTGRDDVTALPYGINTPSVFAFLLFVMAPVYRAHVGELGQEGAAMLAWKAGLVACFGSGVIEFCGAFVAEWVRRNTPRAALLCALAGIAIGFISMTFTLQVFEHPLLALLPAAIILIQYFSGVRLPFGLPAGLVAIIVGAALAWGLKGLDAAGAFAGLGPLISDQIALELAVMPTGEEVRAAMNVSWFPPVLAIGALLDGLTSAEITAMFGVIFPMGLFNVIGSLQNIESAEAEGDAYPTAPSLAVNGLGTIAASAFGSCFPTTIYIGHPGWKRLGARTGYSALNGVVILAFCLFGLIRAFNALVPTVAIIGILIWIAVIIGAQAFQAVPRRHALAVVLGFFPALAAWGFLMFQSGVMAGGTYLGALSLADIDPGVHIGGLIGLDHGFIITSMGWAAIGVYLIDRDFHRAAIWAAVMGGLSFFGVIHAWDPGQLDSPATVGLGVGWRYTVPYLLMAGLLWRLAPQARRLAEMEGPPRDDAPPAH